MKRIGSPLPLWSAQDSRESSPASSASMTIYFDDQPYPAQVGDTVASALLAAGVRLFGRSFKYHRPRGIVAAGVEEPNALLTVGQGPQATPNIAATTIVAEEGLRVYSQNAWPNLAWDWRSINSLFSPLFAAGFYYKTFMGPIKNTKAWMFFEHHIRQAAGLGRLDGSVVPTDEEMRYEHCHDFCDVLVVGGGVAGIQAAVQAAQQGLDTLLVEQEATLGGYALSWGAQHPLRQECAALLSQMQSLVVAGSLRVLCQATAFGLYDSKTVGVVEKRSHFAKASLGEAKEIFHIVRSEKMVFACGALERPLVFAGNDRPGVMLASAVRSYLHRFGVLLGRQAVVCGNNDEAALTALDLARAGAKVTLADTRSEMDAALKSQVLEAGIVLYLRACIVQAHASWVGQKTVNAVTLAHFDATTEKLGAEIGRVEVDLVAMSGGFTPSVHLSTHLGHKPVYDSVCHSYLPSPDLPAYLSCLGAMAGQGLSVFQPLPPLQDGYKRDKAFLDFQHDVLVADIELAQREGYNHVELTKRYTTLGMATDQGKGANMQALNVVARLQGKSLPEIGTTTFRPPYTPVSIGALAGRGVGAHYRLVRRTAIEPWHQAHGAVWTEAGAWRRALWYKTHGDSIGQAYKNEMAFVRQGTGIADVSTLGKIDIQGPDAAEFLNRVYINGFAKLPVGKARYGLMLREDGMVLDDGTTTRLSEYHYFMTTTTAQAGRVMQHLEWLLQVAWPDLRVVVTSSTDQWAAMSIAGQSSRAILQAAFPDLDFSAESLPHMGLLEAVVQADTQEMPPEYQASTAAESETVTGTENSPTKGSAVKLRFIRLSFSGELAYEVYAPTHYGQAVWEHILAVGKPLGLKVYGLEALASLRIEKGHVVGSELDGRTTAADVGLGKMASNLKPYWGSALAQSPELQRAHRPALVGLEAVEESEPPTNGSILFFEGEPLQGVGRGHITSYCYSTVLGKSIALGLLEGGLSHVGETIVATSPVHGRTYSLKVVSPVFYDPQGVRYTDPQAVEIS